MTPAVTVKLTKICQQFNRPRLNNLDAHLQTQFNDMHATIRPGAQIAIAAGSRGITDIAQVIKSTVDFITSQQACPFIIPAMGSHGGATAQGQKEILASLGITQQSMGAPIRSSMETIELPSVEGVDHIYMDRHAYESDGVIVVNRIKPHTDYHGPFESGLVKMTVIGLGKHRQALEMHRLGVYGLKEIVPKVAKVIFQSGKVIAGVGIVENAYHDTMALSVMRGDQIMAQEHALLEMATENMPRLPVNKIDVLIIDRMGKNISGVSMDSNIIGRIRIRGEQDPENPQIKSIVVCDITEESHGNAVGMGLADVMTKRLYKKIDFDATYENARTSTFLERIKVPYVADTDRTALEVALRASNVQPNAARIIRIRDTLCLDEVYVSDPILSELSGQNATERIGEATEPFDDKHELVPF